MMNFEELIKTAICEFSKKKIPHFIVKLCLGIPIKAILKCIEQMAIEQMEIEQMS